MGLLDRPAAVGVGVFVGALEDGDCVTVGFAVGGNVETGGGGGGGTGRGALGVGVGAAIL